MSISADEVRRIAALAALELSDDEVDRLAGELSDILGHFEALEGAEEAEGFTAEGAESAEGTAGGTPLRPDEPAADGLEADPGAAAPGWAAGFFTVPRLASHGTAGSGDTADPEGTADSSESADSAGPSDSADPADSVDFVDPTDPAGSSGGGA